MTMSPGRNCAREEMLDISFERGTLQGFFNHHRGLYAAQGDGADDRDVAATLFKAFVDDSALGARGACGVRVIFRWMPNSSRNQRRRAGSVGCKAWKAARCWASASAARRVFFDGQVEFTQRRPDGGQTDFEATLPPHEGLQFLQGRVWVRGHALRQLQQFGVIKQGINPPTVWQGRQIARSPGVT